MSKAKRVQVSVNPEKKDQLDAQLRKMNLDFGWFVRLCVKRALEGGPDFLLDFMQDKEPLDMISDQDEYVNDEWEEPIATPKHAKSVPTKKTSTKPLKGLARDLELKRIAEEKYPHLYVKGPDNVGLHLRNTKNFELVEAEYNGLKQQGRFDTIWHKNAQAQGKTFPMVCIGRMDSVYQQDDDYLTMRKSGQAVWVVEFNKSIVWRAPTEDEWIDGDLYNGRHTLVLVIDRVMNTEEVDDIFRYRIAV